MAEEDLAPLISYYESLGDEALSQAVQVGERGYRSTAVWQVIAAEASTRGIALPRPDPEPVSQISPEPVDVERAVEKAGVQLGRFLKTPKGIWFLIGVASAIYLLLSGFGKAKTAIAVFVLIYGNAWWVLDWREQRAKTRGSRR